MKTGQRYGKNIGGNAVRGGKGNLALVFFVPPAPYLGTDLLDQLEHGDGFLVQLTPFRRQFHALVPAVEKLHPQFRFQALHQVTYGRLAQTETFRRLGHVAAFRHSIKAAQPLQEVAAETFDHQSLPAERFRAQPETKSP